MAVDPTPVKMRAPNGEQVVTINGSIYTAGSDGYFWIRGADVSDADGMGFTEFVDMPPGEVGEPALLNYPQQAAFGVGVVNKPVGLEYNEDKEVIIDLSAGNVFHLLLDDDLVLDNPPDLEQYVGLSGVIAIKQDDTGSHSLDFGDVWLFPDGGTAVTADADALDLIRFTVITNDTIQAELHNKYGPPVPPSP